MLVGKVTEALAALVEEEPPSPMVDSELNQRMQGMMQQFQAQGIDFAQWMAATGQEPEQFVESMRGQAEESVKVDLALRAVATAEQIEVEPHEVDGEYARMAMQYGQKAKDIRKAYEANDAVPELIAQISKSKALDWLLHNIEFVDEAGTVLDRDTVLGHSHHDHDHDHDDDDDADATSLSDTAESATAESATAEEAPQS
jgi:trigger factor